MARLIAGLVVLALAYDGLNTLRERVGVDWPRFWLIAGLCAAALLVAYMLLHTIYYEGKQRRAREAKDAGAATPGQQVQTKDGETIRQVTFDPNDGDWREGDDVHEEAEIDEEDEDGNPVPAPAVQPLRALKTEIHAFRDAPPTPLLIRYHTEYGQPTERIVRPQLLVTTITESGLRAFPRLRGHCELVRGERTFRLDRVEAASIAETGTVIANLHAYLSQGKGGG